MSLVEVTNIQRWSIENRMTLTLKGDVGNGAVEERK